jgi:tetratricopeptide (TPR) repeat protein
VAYEEGDYAGARTLHEESLQIQRGLGARQSIAMTLSNLGVVAFEQGDYAAARTLQEESLAIRRELGERWGIARSLEELAHVALALALPGRAARIWGAAERLREETGSPLSPRERTHSDPQVASARSAMGDGSAFDSAWQEGRAMTIEQAIEYALNAPEA